jgi:hypothetical protein
VMSSCTASGRRRAEEKLKRGTRRASSELGKE